MSRINSPRKAFVKREEIELEAEGHEKIEDNMKEHQRLQGLPLTKDMSQYISMFRKYLLTKGNIGKTNMEESHVIKTTSTLRPLPAPKLGSSIRRCPSLLEKKLLPQFSKCESIQSPINALKSPTAQLTIFYAGAVNVYDNISLEKAKAIMVIAGESSLPERNSETTNLSELDIKKSTPLPSKFQSDLSIVRKVSCHHFIEKRHNRITSKSPYPLPRDVKEFEATPTTDASESDSNNSLSPFPSRLGHFYSMKS